MVENEIRIFLICCSKSVIVRQTLKMHTLVKIKYKVENVFLFDFFTGLICSPANLAVNFKDEATQN